MCQTIIVNKTHKLRTPNDLIITMPNVRAVMDDHIRVGHTRWPEDEFMSCCLCQIEVGQMLDALNIPYEYDGNYYIELPPEVAEQATRRLGWQ